MAHARSLSGDARVIIDFDHFNWTKFAEDHESTVDAIDYVRSVALTFGDGDNEVNIMFHDRRRVSGGVDDELDLTGVLLDEFGGLLSWTALKLMFFHNRDLTDRLEVFGVCAAADEILSLTSAGQEHIYLPPLSSIMLTNPLAGWAVNPGGPDDIIFVDAGAAGDCLYDVILLGVGTRVEDEPTTTTVTTTTAAPTTTT